MIDKIKNIFLNELKKGTHPRDLTKAVVLGAYIGVFPLLGFTTVISFWSAYHLRLNQLVMQTINYLMYPLQLILLPFYYKLSMTLFPQFSPFQIDQFSISAILDQFKLSPILFFKNFGMIGLISIGIWLSFLLLTYLPATIIINNIIEKRKINI